MDHSKHLVIAIACGAFAVTGYLLYDINSKNKEINRLKQEISILNNLIKETKYKQKSNSFHIENKANGVIQPKRKHSIPNGTVEKSKPNENLRVSILSNESDEEFFDTDESFLDANFKYLIEDIKLLESKGDINYSIIYEMLNKHDYKTPEYYCLKAKFSRFMGRMEEESNSDVKARHFYFEAHKFAKMAETLDFDNVEVKKWCAITLGDLSEFVGLSEKIKNALIIKNYAESCLMISQDPIMFHLLGRWHFKVASLSWLEVRAARAICSDFPSSSFEKALEYFLKAEQIKPNSFIGNLLYIAKCHLASKTPDKETALYWLQKAKRMETHNYDERKALAEVKLILTNEFGDILESSLLIN